MESWSDTAVVLSARKHGEGSAVVSLLTASHGRHAGYVRGGASKAGRAVAQPGTLVQASWGARLDQHLGHLTLEPLVAHAALVMQDAARLACLSAACALADAVLPEREPHPAAYAGLTALLDSFASEAWPTVYVHWELALLRELGFGLNLSSCAATGVTQDLAWVSPRTGRAVSAAVGEPWRDRLLPLPAFLVAGGEGQGDELLAALRLTGHFLARHVLEPQRRTLPEARARFIDRITPSASMS